MKIRAIVTGATGMVGEGVMYECLQHPDVEEVLIINRKPSGFTHPKLKEILHTDFTNLSPIADQLKGYNACYFCLGVSSIGMKEKEYSEVTHDLTMHMANTLAQFNLATTFTYVSGVGTDSTEKGRIMWARVKGRTENDLMKLFPNAYMFRPGYMHSHPGLKNTVKGYKYFSWMYPVLRVLFPNYVCTLKDVGQAMINVTLHGYDKHILEVKDILKTDREHGEK